MKRRFAETSEEEITTKVININSRNTIKANSKAARLLRDYLLEKQQPENFEEFDETSLSEVLSHFYVDARKPDGSQYKITSMEGIRHGLNRYLKSPPYNKPFDIIRDPAFNDANRNFKAVLVDLKKKGLGEVMHHLPINSADRSALYGSIHMSPCTPCGLLNKVQFDIRLYFFRRGAENMRSMTRDTFAVRKDPNSGLKYVTKAVDEMTKNHRQNDKESSSPIMPETPGSPFCPVATFELYLSKLNPGCPSLWQRPRDSFTNDDTVWYCNSAVGEKTLSAFMSTLSRNCKLSQVYSNYSIRSTGATVLSKNLFGPAQIMAVTGHKSVQSLTVYQKVDDDEKIKMGQSLSESLVQTTAVEVPPRVLHRMVQGNNSDNPPSASLVSSVVSDHLEDINLDDLFDDFKENIYTGAPSSHTQNLVSNTQSLRPVLFNDCKVTVIQNLTINNTK